MKTLFLVVAFGTLLAASAPAQETRHEVFAGIGDASLVFDLKDVAGTIFSFGVVSYEDPSGAFQITAGYQNHFAPRWSAGVTGSWARADRDVLFLGTRVDQVERRLWTAIAEARFHWLTLPSVDLYSSLGAGGAWTTDRYELAGSHTDFDTALQLNVVGARVGRDLGAFAELGFGWHGIVKVGLSGRF
jgi:hypothetical protein